MEEMHYKESRKIFNEWIKAGNKLTFDQLKALKDENFKLDYIQEQLL